MSTSFCCCHVCPESSLHSLRLKDTCSNVFQLLCVT